MNDSYCTAIPERTVCRVLPITNGYLVEWVELKLMKPPKGGESLRSMGGIASLAPTHRYERVRLFCAKGEDVVEAVKKALAAEESARKLGGGVPSGWDLAT